MFFTIISTFCFKVICQILFLSDIIIFIRESISRNLFKIAVRESLSREISKYQVGRSRKFCLAKVSTNKITIIMIIIIKYLR